MIYRPNVSGEPMRDPASRADSAEAAIEDIGRFLEGYLQLKSWRADPDRFAITCRVAIEEIKVSNLPDWAKHTAIWALLKQTRKRRGKPTRHNRDDAIMSAAGLLVSRGYKPTRNDVTRDRASASSIICQALDRLGEKISEKQINAIVMKFGSGYLKSFVDLSVLKNSPD